LISGRYLDAPEFTVLHAKGNEENAFDRVDYQISTTDSMHLNVGYTRSWFQTPNSFDNLNLGVIGPDGRPVGPTDQRSKIETLNIAPTWTRVISPSMLFTLGAFVRRDDYNYYPSRNPFADLGPPNLQQETVSQNRTLANVGIRSDVSYVKGIHNVKAAVTYQQTLLTENFSLGIVDPTLNAPCLDANGLAVAGFTEPSQCFGAGLQPNIPSNPNAVTPFIPLLGCYDMTRPNPAPSDNCSSPTSVSYQFHGHTDVKELALYIQDLITKGAWSLSLGVRGDLYNGLTIARQLEPRIGVAYNIKTSNTVLRASYARILETPFNENWCSRAPAASSRSFPISFLVYQPRIRRAIETNSMPAFNRPSDVILSSVASTSGSIRTPVTISAYWPRHRLRFQSDGITPKYPDTWVA
jgi:hypothetical protein